MHAADVLCCYVCGVLQCVRVMSYDADSILSNVLKLNLPEVIISFMLTYCGVTSIMLAECCPDAHWCMHWCMRLTFVE